MWTNRPINIKLRQQSTAILTLVFTPVLTGDASEVLLQRSYEFPITPNTATTVNLPARTDGTLSSWTVAGKEKDLVFFPKRTFAFTTGAAVDLWTLIATGATAPTTISQAIDTALAASSVRVDLAQALTNPQKAQAKTNIGLDLVNNTADADKPVSSATQAALNAKQATLVSGTNLKTVNGSTLLGSGNLTTASIPAIDTLPLVAKFVCYNSAGTAANVYTDTACTTPATADGDLVKGWKDPATGLILANSSSSTCMVLRFESGRPFVRNEKNGGYLTLTNLNFSLTNRQIFIRHRIVTKNNQTKIESNGIISFVDPGTNSFDFEVGTGFYIADRYEPTNGSVSNGYHGAVSSSWTCLECQTDQSSLRIWLDGIERVRHPVLTTSIGLAKSLMIGNRLGQVGASFAAPIDIDTVILANNAIVPKSTLSGFYQKTGDLFYYEGDSLTDSCWGDQLALYPQERWPSILQATSGRTTENHLIGAIWGNVVSDLASRAHVTDRALAQKGSGKLFVWVGTNDINSGTSAATIYAALQAYCQARQAAGWTVYVGTVINRNWSSGAYETIRTDLNTLIRNGFATFSSSYADIGANANLGQAGNYSNSTYFQADGIHLTAAGLQIVASVVAPVFA